MNNETKTTNEMIAKNLEQLAKGTTPANNQLVFNPETGNFDMASASQQLSPDQTTINSIVTDGFAKKIL